MKRDQHAILRRPFTGLAALAIAAVSLVPAVAAANPKLGVVDVKRVMEAVPAWGKAVTELKTDWEKKQAKLQADQEALRKEKEKLDKKAIVSDPKAIATEQAALVQKAQALAGEFVQAQKRITAQEAALKEEMLKRIEPLVFKLAAEGDYAYIFETGTHQAPNVLYAASRIDLTKRVIQRYKKRYKNQAFDTKIASSGGASR